MNEGVKGLNILILKPAKHKIMTFHQVFLEAKHKLMQMFSLYRDLLNTDQPIKGESNDY